jgi:surface protein
MSSILNSSYLEDLGLSDEEIHIIFKYVGISFNNFTLKFAVWEWLSNQEEAKQQYGTIKHWDVSNVTDMSYLFKDAKNFNEAIGNWDVSNVTDMSSMFAGASNFNQPIGKWNVSKVQKMRYMFKVAESFNQTIEDWDVKSVTSLYNMFSAEVLIDQIPKTWNEKLSTDVKYILMTDRGVCIDEYGNRIDEDSDYDFYNKIDLFLLKNLHY